MESNLIAFCPAYFSGMREVCLDGRKARVNIMQEKTTIVHVLEQHAASHPEKTAFTYLPDGEEEGEKRSFRELDRRARAIAHRLLSMGLAGRPVLLLVPDLLKFIDAFMGSCYAGAVPVAAVVPRPNRPLDPIRAIGRDAEVGAVILPSSELAYLKTELAADFNDVPWILLDEIDYTTNEPRRSTVRPDDLAFLQYTSGSTGTPKGVVVQHQQLVHNEMVIAKSMALNADSVQASWLPLFHDMGLIGSILQPVYSGFHCVVLPPVAFIQKPMRWLHAISKYRATLAGAPNFAYDLCVAKSTPEQREQLDLSDWKVAYSGSEPVRAETVRRFTSAFVPARLNFGSFYPCYGMAECTLFTAGITQGCGPKIIRVESEALLAGKIILSEKMESGTDLVGCGAPGQEMEIAIVDPDTRERLPDNVVGEIWISGPSVAAGYYRKPELTSEIFEATCADGGAKRFLRSGDLGFLHEDQVFITGRIKDVIIVRGRNHYPQDLELTVQRSSPMFTSCFGAAVPIEKQGHNGIAIIQEVTREAWWSAKPEELAATVREAIASAHGLLVTDVVFIKPGTLPRTSSGKVRRSLCRAMFESKKFEILQKAAEVRSLR